MLKRLDNVGIAVRDLAVAHRFYTEVLGFAAAPLAEGDEGFGARLGDVALYIFGTTATDGADRSVHYTRNPPGLDHLAFEVEDFEAAQAELERRGVKFDQAAVGEPGGFRYRGFTDPDGNMLYVIHHGER